MFFQMVTSLKAKVSLLNHRALILEIHHIIHKLSMSLVSEFHNLPS